MFYVHPYLGNDPIWLFFLDGLKPPTRKKQKNKFLDVFLSKCKLRAVICNTVDGRNPANQLRLVVYPINYKVNKNPYDSEATFVI